MQLEIELLVTLTILQHFLMLLQWNAPSPVSVSQWDFSFEMLESYPCSLEISVSSLAKPNELQTMLDPALLFSRDRGVRTIPMTSIVHLSKRLGAIIMRL